MSSVSSILSTVNKISKVYDDMQRANVQNISIVNSTINFLNGRVYIPAQTAVDFHNDNHFVRLVMGPYGSGKSSMCCAEIILRACAMPSCCDGVRRSRCVVIRNTYSELLLTTVKTWRDWFGGLGLIRSTSTAPITYEHRFNDGNGIVELELIFIALDNDIDIKKLRSLETTMVFINESKELPLSILEHAAFRCGRYPSVQMLGNDDSNYKSSYWHGVIMDTNPPDTDSWIYSKFEVDRVSGYKIYKQPAGLIKDDDNKWTINNKAENLNNIGKDYYIKNSLGKTEEFINVYCNGNYGIVIDGKPVYAQYNDDVHSMDSLDVIDGLPVMVSFDFGLTPACAFMQLCGGQLRIFKEFTTDRMGIRELSEQIVLPYIKSSLANNEILSTCDPSGVRAVDTDTNSCVKVLHDLGINVFPAFTNAIVPRVEAVNFFLNKMSNGKPSFIISRKGCPMLRKGFNGKYHYRRVRVSGQDRYQDLPEKSHPFSDIQDCVQYGALYYSGDIIQNNSIERESKKDKDYFCNSSMWA